MTLAERREGLLGPSWASPLRGRGFAAFKIASGDFVEPEGSSTLPCSAGLPGAPPTGLQEGQWRRECGPDRKQRAAAGLWRHSPPTDQLGARCRETVRRAGDRNAHRAMPRERLRPARGARRPSRATVESGASTTTRDLFPPPKLRQTPIPDRPDEQLYTLPSCATYASSLRAATVPGSFVTRSNTTTEETPRWHNPDDDATKSRLRPTPRDDACS